MAIQVTISGVRKAAILSLVLGEEAVAGIFKHLSEDEVERVAREVAVLGTVQPEMGERVLDEFHHLALAAGYVTRGGVDCASKLLNRAFDQPDAARIMERVVRSFNTTAGFSSLEQADTQQLSKFILAESPQTIALILAHLNSGKAAQLIALLPDDLRADVVTRMAGLDDIAPEVVGR